MTDDDNGGEFCSGVHIFFLVFFRVFFLIPVAFQDARMATGCQEMAFEPEPLCSPAQAGNTGRAAATPMGAGLYHKGIETRQGGPGGVGVGARVTDVTDMEDSADEWARIEQEQLRHVAQLEKFVGEDVPMMGPGEVESNAYGLNCEKYGEWLLIFVNCLLNRQWGRINYDGIGGV